jgi:F-type H+-transporting ATPase subunit b
MSAKIIRVLLSPMIVTAALLIAPGVALAAEEGGGKWAPTLTTIGRFFNLALVIAVLVWVGRKPLAAFCVNRTQLIREQLEEARRAKEAAEAKLAEAAQRMARLEDELREMRATAEREAQEEYGRLVAAAERDAEKIVERTRQEINGMTRAAQNELRQHAATLAVQLAEEKIRTDMTPEDRARLFGQFVTGLGDKQ